MGKPVDESSQRRLYWKCRRGLLELDLVFAKYLEAKPYDEELVEFLDLQDNDNELWDIVSGRSDRYDARFGGIVARLRAI
jgi:antitoxin CptB